MANEDPSVTVERILESGRNVRLGRGVVAKTSYVAALTVAMWGMIAWRWSAELGNNLGMLFAGLVATSFAFWFIRSTQDFAAKNPAQAMLEGAELLEWRRMDAKVKGMPEGSLLPTVETTTTPLIEQKD